MGTSYSNITVKADTARIIGYLKYARQSAYVSLTADGFTVVCQEEIDPSGLAEEISRDLRCLALAVLNDDDDALMYELWDRGQLVDQHVWGRTQVDSAGPQVIAPDEWTPDSDREHRRECWGSDDEDDEAPPHGDAQALCRAFGRTEVLEDVEALLRVGLGDDAAHVLSHHYHIDLARLLSIACFVGSFGSLESSPEQGWTRVG